MLQFSLTVARVWKEGNLIPLSSFLFHDNSASRTYFIDIPNIIFNLSPNPCPKYWPTRVPGSSQIPYPVKSFAIYALYFVQIWDPGNTLPYPVNSAYRPISVWQLRFTKVNTELTPQSFNIDNCSNYALSLAIFNVCEDCNVQIFLWLSKGNKFLGILFS